MSEQQPRVVPARTVWCKYYRGRSQHDTCEAGVKYADVQKDHEPIAYRNERMKTVYTKTRSLPCIPGDNLGGATCEKCAVPTAEELAAEEAELAARFERMQTAREAIVAHLGGRWKKGAPGARGRIDCPACGLPNGLAFSRSGYNGHINAACATPGCCSWME